MLNKSILLTLTVAALFSAALAACPSACSGHGSCGNHDKCSCYMNWEGSDCSAKSCPQGENGKSCSGRGTCDSGAGECACSEGYSGVACQRTLCPNDCSGKGTCDFTSGLCSCYGGFSGNDCSSRMCPRGDDPLTHEVENQGDGTVMQQAEVQEVTFSAGMGIGGSVTLTYTDLYGQSWTTRPISLGEGSHYVLDYALGSGVPADKENTFLNLKYAEAGNTDDPVSTGCNSFRTEDNANIANSNTDEVELTAAKIRKTLLLLTNIKDTDAKARANLARSVHVTERPHKTSHKFTTGIETDTKKTFDIYITQHHTTGLDENGGLLELTAGLGNSDASSNTAGANLISAGNAFVGIRSMSDASSAIKSALEALPNSVLPAVTVSKVDVTTANTNDLGTNGNAYHQTYRITFSSAANSGDQNMLSCDAEPCDSDGCINRKVGAASVHYIHADPTFTDTTANRKTPRINFQGKGYFIMDIHRTVVAVPAQNDFSSGTAYVEWNTGSGVERAEFPIIADAATVETSLRTISGWSGVTVSCSSGGSGCTDSNRDRAHSYTVTFPSGYDDGGQTPKVGLVDGYGGTAAGSNNDGAIIIYDQRFSNSLWLGDITGYELVTCKNSDGARDYCDTSSDTVQGEIGDKIEVAFNQFGHTAYTVGQTPAVEDNGNVVLSKTYTNIFFSGRDFGFADASFATHTNDADTFSAFVRVNHAEDFPLQTSQNTEHYFSVGSTIEVLESTWADTAPATRVPTGSDVVTNAYRSFKVLSHVKNTHGHMFAKLDSVPTTDSATQYALKVTSHNSTVTNRKNIEVNGRQQEIQAIQTTTSDVFVTGGTDTYRIYINRYKANVEFTEVLSGASSAAQIAEAINSFSALSGPVTVAKSDAHFEIQVTFAAIDGDVPELEAVSLEESSSIVFSVHTLQEGWSFFAGHTARLENVQPGSVINITSREKVTFDITTWAGDAKLVFSYDGHVGGTALDEGTNGNAPTAALVATAVNSIKDNKGAVKVGLAGADVTVTGTSKIVIKMPKGMDGSKLELLMAEGEGAAGITKSVEKNNNGRSFKVKRVENKVIPFVPDAIAAAKLTFDANNKLAVKFDEIQFKQGTVGTDCQAITTAGEYVSYRSIASITHHGDSQTKTDYAVATVGTNTGGCSINVYRTTIVVDSMPDAVNRDAFGENVDMHIYGPKGTCSVSEAVKGTYESDVCSSRGNCDGASGLCVCHEGYSGEACETQTVLV